MAFRAQPLPTSFFLVSILGFLISFVYTLSGKLDRTWGFTFIVVFVIMFVATLVSLEPTPEES